MSRSHHEQQRRVEAESVELGATPQRRLTISSLRRARLLTSSNTSPSFTSSRVLASDSALMPANHGPLVMLAGTMPTSRHHRASVGEDADEVCAAEDPAGQTELLGRVIITPDAAVPPSARRIKVIDRGSRAYPASLLMMLSPGLG